MLKITYWLCYTIVTRIPPTGGAYERNGKKRHENLQSGSHNPEKRGVLSPLTALVNGSSTGIYKAIGDNRQLLTSDKRGERCGAKKNIAISAQTRLYWAHHYHGPW